MDNTQKILRVKTPEELQAEKIRATVDRLAAIQQEQDRLKEEAAPLEGFLLKLAESDLRNTKLQTVRFAGSGGARVQATMAQSIKVQYPTLLEKVFGLVYKDAVTVDTEPKYTFSAAAKRMLTGLYLKKYTEMTREAVLRQAITDNAAFETALKRVKGANFKNDKKNLIAIAGLDEQSAEEYAYFVAEAVVWEDFQRVLRADGRLTEEAQKEVLGYIDTAIIVDETPKIAVEVQ